MFACVRICMFVPLLSSVRPFNHPPKDWEGRERRRKWWKEVEREAIQDLASPSNAGRHV